MIAVNLSNVALATLQIGSCGTVRVEFVECGRVPVGVGHTLTGGLAPERSPEATHVPGYTEGALRIT